MRRANLQSGYECSTSSRSSSWLSGLMSLAGGVGIGAGLLYLLDPEQGEKRRRNISSGARSLGSNLAESASDWLTSAGDYAGDTARSASKSTRRFASDRADEASGVLGGALSSVRGFVGEKLGGVGDYAAEKYENAKGYVQDQVCEETRMQHRVNVGICALSSMAIGAALMYVFDPTMGSTRRRTAMDKAGDMASSAGDYATQAGGYVKEQASNLTSQAGDMMSQAKDKVTGMASNLTSGSAGASCPPGMIPASQANASLNAGTRSTF
jgi:gas vesicle protein